MITLYLNRKIDDDARRESLFNGDFYLYTGLSGAAGLVAHARDLVAQAFGDLDPERAQFGMDVDEFVRRSPRSRRSSPTGSARRSCASGSPPISGSTRNGPTSTSRGCA
ncbi:hypothetical protein BJF78_36010 [Pseudonocardia sp. CNS-139]|nr:hypothetical protein BJF78_36010 [Pseudonocardia sp. CNS-139]